MERKREPCGCHLVFVQSVHEYHRVKSPFFQALLFDGVLQQNSTERNKAKKVQDNIKVVLDWEAQRLRQNIEYTSLGGFFTL